MIARHPDDNSWVCDNATCSMIVPCSVLNMRETPVELKLVFIGDGSTGKTCLQEVYEKEAYLDRYNPTIFHHAVKKVQHTFGGRLRNVNLQLWDSAGQEEYQEARKTIYPDANLVMIAFSVAEPDSLANVENIWIGEASAFCPGIPVILVGTKTDLREDEKTIQDLKLRNLHPVTYTEGVTMAKSIGAKAYIECSAKEGYNVKAVFDEAMDVFFRNEAKTTKKGACCFSLLSLAGRCTEQSRHQPEAFE